MPLRQAASPSGSRSSGHAGMVDDDLGIRMPARGSGALGHLRRVELHVERQAMRPQPTEPPLPRLFAHIFALDEIDARVLVAIEDLADAPGVGEGCMRRQGAVDLRVGEIGISDDAVREAATARCVGDGLEPAGFLDGQMIVGDLGLEMDGLRQFDRRGIRQEIRQQVVATERRGIADEARNRGGGEPGIADADPDPKGDDGRRRYASGPLPSPGRKRGAGAGSSR